jgi:hypothetical protein
MTTEKWTDAQIALTDIEEIFLRARETSRHTPHRAACGTWIERFRNLANIVIDWYSGMEPVSL